MNENVVDFVGGCLGGMKISILVFKKVICRTCVMCHVYSI